MTKIRPKFIIVDQPYRKINRWHFFPVDLSRVQSGLSTLADFLET